MILHEEGVYYQRFPFQTVVVTLLVAGNDTRSSSSGSVIELLNLVTPLAKSFCAFICPCSAHWWLAEWNDNNARVIVCFPAGHATAEAHLQPPRREQPLPHPDGPGGGGSGRGRHSRDQCHHSPGVKLARRPQMSACSSSVWSQRSDTAVTTWHNACMQEQKLLWGRPLNNKQPGSGCNTLSNLWICVSDGCGGCCSDTADPEFDKRSGQKEPAVPDAEGLEQNSLRKSDYRPCDRKHWVLE